eukprot:381145_1
MAQSSSVNVSIRTYNTNDLQIACNNSIIMAKITNWYSQLTQCMVQVIKNKYLKKVLLEDARGSSVFGDFGWIQIILDFMLSIGFNKPSIYSKATGNVELLFVSTNIVTADDETNDVETELVESKCDDTLSSMDKTMDEETDNLIAARSSNTLQDLASLSDDESKY